LAQVLCLVYPDIEKMLPVENWRYVSFEWIGRENYLGERVSRGGQRSRGANCTSADSIVMFERRDKKRQIVLIEWKYTESYGGNSLKIAASGTDRAEIYRHLFEKADCPIDKEILPGFDSLFYEPFYQFMRQQFLANEMEKAHEPAQSRGKRSILRRPIMTISASHTEFGRTWQFSTSIWKRLVRNEGRLLASASKSCSVIVETPVP
jgi:hypothetical protein